MRSSAPTGGLRRLLQAEVAIAGIALVQALLPLVLWLPIGFAADARPSGDEIVLLVLGALSYLLLGGLLLKVVLARLGGRPNGDRRVAWVLLLGGLPKLVVRAVAPA